MVERSIEQSIIRAWVKIRLLQLLGLIMSPIILGGVILLASHIQLSDVRSVVGLQRITVECLNRKTQNFSRCKFPLDNMERLHLDQCQKSAQAVQHCAATARVRTERFWQAALKQRRAMQ